MRCSKPEVVIVVVNEKLTIWLLIQWVCIAQYIFLLGLGSLHLSPGRASSDPVQAQRRAVIQLHRAPPALGTRPLFSKELLLFHSLLLLCSWEGWEKEQVARPFRDKERPAVDNRGFLPPELLCRKDQERQVQTKALTTLLLVSWCLNQHLCKRMNELEHKLLQQLQSLWSYWSSSLYLGSITVGWYQNRVCLGVGEDQFGGQRCT